MTKYFLVFNINIKTEDDNLAKYLFSMINIYFKQLNVTLAQNKKNCDSTTSASFCVCIHDSIK